MRFRRIADERGDLEAVRMAVGGLLALGGIVAMLVTFFAFVSLPGLYCSAGAALVGGALLGVRFFAGALMAVGFVGGFCVLAIAIGAENGRVVPMSATVFGILTPVLVFAGLVILAISLQRRGSDRGWPWASS